MVVKDNDQVREQDSDDSVSLLECLTPKLGLFRRIVDLEILEY